MDESIGFFWIIHPQFPHYDAVCMHHTFQNGKSVLAHYVDVYVSINTKIIDNYNVPNTTYTDLFLVLSKTKGCILS